MGGARRRGRWVVPRRYTCFALMGGIELDLREAQFSQRDVTIQAFSLMGGVDVRRKALKPGKGKQDRAVDPDHRRQIDE